MSLQNENVRFEQNRNVRLHRWPRGADLRGAQVEIERRLGGSDWLRFHNR
jgi:hypothetical protein